MKFITNPKNNLARTALTLLLAVLTTTAWALEQDGEGYYLLGSLQDWKDFAALVNGGTTNANARMTADIDLGDDQTKIGDIDVAYAYQGVFDGQGHTLNVNYYSTSSSTAAEGGYSIAPFRNINGATIKNLSVTGSITGYMHPSGVVGYTVSPSTNLISNVIVSATITATGGYAGGFIGHCETSTTTIQDCLFNGFIDGSTVGVFFGWSGYASMFLTNCMENGTYVNCSTFTPTSCPGYGTPTVTNCYYMVSGSYSGTQATAAQLADGTIAYKLQNNRADLVWGQRIGNDAKPVLTSDESYRVYKCINGGYTNDPDLAYTGLEQDAEGYYLLGSLFDWQEFASLVNSGTTNANARMTADIDLGDEQTMVGKYATRYSGIFDGQGHTLTINYNTSSMSIESGQAYLGAAPFRDIEGATIRNVHTAGNITVDKIGASGLVGWAYGTNTIENCWSDVNLVSSNGTADTFCGFVAFLYGSSINIKDCIFTGLIQSTSKQSHSGFIGYHNSGTSVLTNCLVILDEGSDASRTSPCGVMYFTFDRFACGDQSGGTYTNCFYYRDFGVVQGTKVTDEQLSNGTIAYQLQNNRGDLVWGQRIGIDTAPVLTSDESYRVYYINGSYTNDPDFAYTGLVQDAEGYYLLGSLLDWQEFAALVQTTPTANAKMTADIDLGDDQTVIGSTTVSTTAYSLGSGTHYQGIFDGQGHTLTVAYNATGSNSASPFSSIEGATIKNLHIDGTMVSSYYCGAGVASATGGNGNVIQNVWVSTTISATNGYSAGFVGCAKNGSISIVDCLFTGSVTSSQSHNGCFVGYIDSGSVTVTNCLSTGSFTYYGCAWQGSHTNCYVKQFPASIPAAMQVTDGQLSDGTTAYKLQNNRVDLVWGQRIGFDDEPVFTSDESYRVYRCINGGYTNDPDLAYTGLEQDAEGYYLLGSLFDWQEFAALVNGGTTNANARMTADIDLGDDQTHIGSMTEGTEPFYAGVFDGQGHTLTIHYVGGSNQIVAPFTKTSNGTIKNLHVAGSIQSAFAYIGVVGMAGGNSVISNVWMSATMQTSQSGWVQSAAIAGYCDGTIQDCLFTGTFTSGSLGYMGGFYGYTNGSPTVTNCLSTGTFNNGNWQGNGIHTNCYLKQYPTGLTSGCSWATDETLADGTIAYQLQNNRGDLVWGQRIGIDTVPVLTSDESYRVYYINGSYTNDPDPAIPCSDPAELSVTQTSYTSFTLAWTAGNSVAWDVQYRAIGALSWTSFGTVNVATCTLTDLEESTRYEAQVKATCSDTWVSFDNFTTSEIPAAIDVDLDHPFSVNFASLSAIPDNWIAVGWTLEANSYIYSGNTGTCYLYSPVLNITTGGKIRVYSRTKTINYSENSSHTLTILATTDGGNTFEEATIPASATPNFEPSIYSYNIPSSWIGKQLQIVFKYETPGVGVNRWDIHEVDINVGTIFQNNNYNYDGNWTSSQNWTNGIPNENIDAKIIADVNIRTGHYVAAHNITISTGVTLTLYNNSSLTCNEITNNGTIVIQDGGQLICNNNPTVTMQKSITGYGNNNEVKTGWNFIASPITEELSPSSEFMLWNTYDLYRLNNTTWENYRAHTQDFTINNGKGYLYANSGNVTLSFTGTIKPFTTESNANQVALTDGWNLVGNPYTFNVYSSKSYYKITTTTIDNVEQNVVTAVTSPSNYIAPCTGIVVKSTGIGSVAFTKTAPAEWSTGNQGNIQMTLAQQATNRGSAATIDNAIVSFNEGSLLGKFYFGTQKANLYIPQGTEEYAIAYSDGQGEMPVNFRANENGQYTITVNPEGVEMAYLHLIDNMTGADVDLLSTQNVIAGEDPQSPAQRGYTFTARTTDYESRFKLVFVAKDIDGSSTGSSTFAYVNNGNLIVNGEGTLQVIDVMGRIIVSVDGRTRCVPTSGMVSGVYVLRLINGENTKVQKIVIQ